MDAIARQMQGQERMTREIAEAIEAAARPKGTAVAVIARHHCISDRGVRQQDSDTVTLLTRGVLDGPSPLRADFLALCRLNH